MMRKYADYIGLESFVRSWVITELEELYSEKKVTGATVRTWCEDKCSYSFRQLPNYESIKRQNWKSWKHGFKFSSIFPNRNDPVINNLPELYLNESVCNVERIEHFLQKGQDVIKTNLKLIASPTFHLEVDEKATFYQDIVGREYEKSEMEYSLSILVQGKNNRASSTISCRDIDNEDWNIICENLEGKLSYINIGYQKKVENCTVVLTQKGSIEFLKALGNLFKADNIFRTIPILWGKQGKKIASSIFSLKDIAHIPYSLHSTPFDDEGVISRDVAIISKGVFKEPLHSLETSTRLNQLPNGRAFRKNIDSMPKIQHTNLEVVAGEQSTIELLKEYNEVYLIENSYNGQIQAGKFSFMAEGWRVLNGEKVEWLNQIKVEAPLFQMLREISSVACDGYANGTFSGFKSPSITIRSMSLTY